MLSFLTPLEKTKLYLFVLFKFSTAVFKYSFRSTSFVFISKKILSFFKEIFKPSQILFLFPILWKVLLLLKWAVGTFSLRLSMIFCNAVNCSFLSLLISLTLFASFIIGDGTTISWK